MSRLLLVAAVIAVVVGGCSDAATSSLSDAEALWCREHDMKPHPDFGSRLTWVRADYVQDIAKQLDIEIPDSVDSANRKYMLAWPLNNVANGRSYLDNVPDFYDDLEGWRKTGDYARACKAAYELR